MTSPIDWITDIWLGFCSGIAAFIRRSSAISAASTPSVRGVQADVQIGIAPQQTGDDLAKRCRVLNGKAMECAGTMFVLPSRRSSRRALSVRHEPPALSGIPAKNRPR